MNLRALATEAGYLGWRQALLMKATERLESLLGIWIFRVNVRNLSNAGPSPAFPHGVTVRLLDEIQLVHYVNDPEFDLDSRFIRRAMARGDLAFGAFEEGRLLGYTWRTSSTAPWFDGLWIRVPRLFAYAYKSYTSPFYRGRGVYAACASFADRNMRALGHPMTINMIDIANLPSHHASARMGSVRAGYAGYLKLFGKCFAFRTHGVRALGIEFYTPPREARSTETPPAAAVPLSPVPAPQQVLA